MRSSIEWIQGLIETGREELFYNSQAWDLKRREVIALDHHECVICKAKGKCTTRNLMVHHVNHLREHPEYALSIWVGEGNNRRRNLITVCKDCHENECHPERLKKYAKTSEPLTEERWD